MENFLQVLYALVALGRPGAATILPPLGTLAIALISAIVLTHESRAVDDLATEREIIARSMIWLVSAVVAGVVRDVTLATPAGLGLSDLADQSGCELVQAESEAERLAQAAALCREDRVLILRTGFYPDAGMIEEIDAFVHREGPDAQAVILERPSRLAHHLMPRLTPAAAVLVKTQAARAAASFKRLAAPVRRAGTILQGRARPIA